MAVLLRNLNPQRIALIKPSALGDIAHSLPVLTGLRELYPQASITWIVNRAFEPLLAGHPHLTDTYAFDRSAYKKGLISSARYSLKLANALRRRRFDLVIDLQGLLRTGLMTASTGSPVRIGFDNAREGSRRFYTHRIEVPDADKIHAIDRYWRIIEVLGGERFTKQCIVPVNAEDREQALATLISLPRPYLAVAVGAKWLTKRWPPASFAELIRRFHQEFQGTALLLGSPEDIPLSAEVTQSLTGPMLDLTGKTSISRLVATLSLCDAMLANDTGPTHVAAALGVPCVVPYLCTKVALHGPYTLPGMPPSVGIETNVPCKGSYLKQCPNNMICMSELTPDRIWPALLEANRSYR